MPARKLPSLQEALERLAGQREFGPLDRRLEIVLDEATDEVIDALAATLGQNQRSKAARALLRRGAEALREDTEQRQA